MQKIAFICQCIQSKHFSVYNKNVALSIIHSQIKRSMNTLCQLPKIIMRLSVCLSDHSTTLHLICGKSEALIHIHSHTTRHTQRYSSARLNVSQLSSTEHVLLPFYDQSPSQRRRWMCAAAVVRVHLHPHAYVVIVYKDWNKASKSKRHGLLHHRVQVPTLWGELKCVRDRASDERQHYFRQREREKTEALKGGYDKLLIKAVQRAQSHLSLWYISQSTAADRVRWKKRLF